MELLFLSKCTIFWMVCHAEPFHASKRIGPTTVTEGIYLYYQWRVHMRVFISLWQYIQTEQSTKVEFKSHFRQPHLGISHVYWIKCIKDNTYPMLKHYIMKQYMEHRGKILYILNLCIRWRQFASCFCHLYDWEMHL